jgi:hypothetical protein
MYDLMLATVIMTFPVWFAFGAAYIGDWLSGVV